MRWSAQADPQPWRRRIRVDCHLFQNHFIPLRWHGPVTETFRCREHCLRLDEHQFVFLQLYQRRLTVFALLLLQTMLEEARTLATVSRDPPTHAIGLRDGGLTGLEDPIRHPTPDQQGHGHHQEENSRSLSHLSLNYPMQDTARRRNSMTQLLPFSQISRNVSDRLRES